MFKRLPGCQKGDTLKLARYLIESSDGSEVEFDNFRAAKAFDVAQKLADSLGDYPTFAAEAEAGVKETLRQARYPADRVETGGEDCAGYKDTQVAGEGKGNHHT